MMNESTLEWSGFQPLAVSLENSSDLNISSNASSESELKASLNWPYVACEILVAVIAVLGNALTIVVFAVDRKLRRLTNYYIVSLAAADLLVGMPGIPFAILTSVGIPKNFYMCLPMLSLLLVLCTVSILSLVAVSVDRYWAILYPLRYSRVMTAKIARRIIMLCWIAGIFVGSLPMMGWREPYPGVCFFTKVTDYDYLVFIYFSTIVGPGLLMAVFYAHIYTVVLKQTKLSVKSEHGTLRQIAAQEPQSEAGSVCTQHGGSQKQRSYFVKNRSHGDINRCDSRRCSTSTNTMPQVTHASKREVKAAKSLSIIVLFFLICWLPLYTINCIQAFCKDFSVPPEVMFFTIILTHVNSAVNPFLYAYHMKDFRLALKAFIQQRILRRRLRSDQLYGSRLISHHSTVYRMTVGGGSPQLGQIPPSQAQNTPVTSSPSPVTGTPGGYRSCSSTVGSYGPCLPSRGTSSSASLLRAPESKYEPLYRPRAATITSHTAPSSVHSSRRGAGGTRKPVYSVNNVIISVNISQNNKRHQTSISSSDISGFTSTADPTDVIIKTEQYDDENVGSNSHSTSQYPVTSDSCRMCKASSDTLLTTENSTRLSNIYHNSNLSSLADKSVNDREKTIYDGLEFNAHGENSDDNGSPIDFQKVPEDAEKRFPKENVSHKCERHKLLSGNECISENTSRCSCEIRNIEIFEEKSDSHLNTNHRVHQESKANGKENLFKVNSEKILLSPEAITMLQIPNGTEGITGTHETKPSCDVTNNEMRTINSMPTSNQHQNPQKTSESSYLRQEFCKFLPKMLRSKEDSRKRKTSKTGKSWFSGMMRNRSYHGLSVDIVGSKELPRAKSISGAMGT